MPTTSTAPESIAAFIAAALRKPPVSIIGVFTARRIFAANGKKYASRFWVDSLSPAAPVGDEEGILPVADPSTSCTPVIAALSSAAVMLLLAGTVISSYFAIKADIAARLADAKKVEAQNNAAQALIEKYRANAKSYEARRNLYISHMNLAQAAWDDSNVGRVVDLLKQHEPQAGEELKTRRYLDLNWFDFPLYGGMMIRHLAKAQVMYDMAAPAGAPSERAQMKLESVAEESGDHASSAVVAPPSSISEPGKQGGAEAGRGDQGGGPAGTGAGARQCRGAGAGYRRQAAGVCRQRR